MYVFESLIKTSNVNICLLATEVGLSFESHEDERIPPRILEPGYEKHSGLSSLLRCAGCAMAHPDFGRSVNPISTRGGHLMNYDFETFRQP